MLLAEEVLIVQDNTGGIFTYLWSFDQENIFFYKPSEKLLISEFPEGTLVRKGKLLINISSSMITIRCGTIQYQLNTSI